MALGNLDGLLVTVPYKARILRFADRLTTSQLSVIFSGVSPTPVSSMVMRPVY